MNRDYFSCDCEKTFEKQGNIWPICWNFSAVFRHESGLIEDEQRSSKGAHPDLNGVARL